MAKKIKTDENIPGEAAPLYLDYILTESSPIARLIREAIERIYENRDYARGCFPLDTLKDDFRYDNGRGLRTMREMEKIYIGARINIHLLRLGTKTNPDIKDVEKETEKAYKKAGFGAKQATHFMKGLKNFTEAGMAVLFSDSPEVGGRQ